MKITPMSVDYTDTVLKMVSYLLQTTQDPMATIDQRTGAFMLGRATGHSTVARKLIQRCEAEGIKVTYVVHSHMMAREASRAYNIDARTPHQAEQGMRGVHINRHQRHLYIFDSVDTNTRDYCELVHTIESIFSGRNPGAVYFHLQPR